MKRNEKKVVKDYEQMMQGFQAAYIPSFNQKWEKRGDRFVTFSLYDKNELSVGGNNNSIIPLR
ncbi:MAG: hypothetical protein FWF52_03720 [Candidatus Azobacteroides sp.]|nr:hypothetical protein [Candidatus Azobacteroides sp.]